MAPHLPPTRALLVLGLIVAIGEPFMFSGAFAGDAEVHLVFMESAAQGRFFEFNRGETVSGETSPAYMMLGAALFRVLPPTWMPIALKLVGLLCWYAFCWFVYRVAVRLLESDDSSRGWPAAAAILAATLPGSVYNANAGMENGLFAALVWGWILLVDRWRWFESRDVSVARELAGAFLIGISCWFRPEGAVVALVATLFRLVFARPRIGLWLMGCLVIALVGGASVTFQSAFTGDLVATSILSRRVLAMPNFVSLGFLTFDPTFGKRLLVYLPITALFVRGIWSSDAHPVRPLERFLRVLLAIFFVLYSLAGTPQLARYVIFLMPILVIGAVRGARALWRDRRFRPIVAVAAAAVVVVNVAEPWYRMQLYHWGLIRKVIATPSRRHEMTDELLRKLEDPVERPVIVATESVQLRYELDDRVVVRSLDGRVDRALLPFVHHDTVDHVGYLEARRVAYLLQTPSYNRDPSAWSLKELRKIDPGTDLQRDGISFRRLPPGDKFALTARP